MSALVDARPAGIDLLFRPATTLTVVLSWPAGSLAGRSFTSTLGVEPLSVNVAGDVMTVVATDTQTGAVSEAATWLLLEDVDGTPEPIIVGTWAPSDEAAAVSSQTVTVTQGTASVDVAVSTVGGVVALHEARQHREYTEVSSDWVDRVRALLSEASERQVIVRAWGGSITLGNPGASDPRSTSWVQLVAQALRDEYGDGGTGYLPLHLADPISGWSTLTSSGTRIGFGSVEARAGGTAVATFTGLRGTRIRIFHRNTSITGSYRYRIDGGSYTTVNVPNGFSQDPGSVQIDGLTDVPHTLDIEWVSGTVGVNGVEATYDTGIVFQLCSVGGRAVSQYAPQKDRRAEITITNGSTTITCAAPGHFTSADVGKYLHSNDSGLNSEAQIVSVESATSATISHAATASDTIVADFCRNSKLNTTWPTVTVGNVFQPGLGTADLHIFGLGVNDGGYSEADLSSVAHGLNQLISSGSREVLILSEHHAAFANFGYAIGTRALGQAAAAALGGGYVDVWTKGRHSFAYADGEGWLHDTVHPSDTGHAVYAADVIALLVGGQ